MNHVPHRFRYKTALFAALGAGLIAVPVLAQGPAGNAGAGREGRMERMAERMKERCERFEERLANTDKKLTAEQVRDIIAGRLAEAGNPNIKAGKARQKGDVITVEIVTKDGSLINTREISSKTGLHPQAADRCDKIEERIEKAKADGDGRGRHGFRGGRDGRGFGVRGDRGGMALLGDVGPDRDLNLTAAQVKTLAESRLIMLGNDRLKVGAVKEKDKDTYTVDIVTADNSLVLRREVDKHTGRQNKAD